VNTEKITVIWYKSDMTNYKDKGLANAKRLCDCSVLCLCLKSSLCSCLYSILDTTSFGSTDSVRCANMHIDATTG